MPLEIGENLTVSDIDEDGNVTLYDDGGNSHQIPADDNWTQREIRYVMLDEEGNPVEKYHQDDESDVCESDTIEGLLDLVAERVFDMASLDLLESITELGSEDDHVEKIDKALLTIEWADGELSKFKIVRQEVLTYGDDDLRDEIKKVKERLATEREEYRKQMGWD